MAKKELTAHRVRELFDYDPEVGVLTTAYAKAATELRGEFGRVA